MPPHMYWLARPLDQAFSLRYNPTLPCGCVLLGVATSNDIRAFMSGFETLQHQASSVQCKCIAFPITTAHPPLAFTAWMTCC